MKVIFVKQLSGTAKAGEIKEVNDGYAKNFLIAKGFAQVVTPQIQAKVEKESKEAETKKLKEIEKLHSLKADLEKRIFSVKVKVGDKGQIFSGVHEKDVAKALNDATKGNLEKNQVELSAIIRELGEHQVKVKLASGINATVKIKVEAQ